MRTQLARLLAANLFHRPIFQVGASRSGTIVLYKALGTHPKILSMPGENPFVTYVTAAVMPFVSGSDPKYFNESVRISQDYLHSRLRDLLFESTAGPHLGLRTLVKALRDDRFAYFKKRFWCVKCFPREDDARALTLLYPECKFIYIVRNGIDVVQSRTKFPVFRDQPFEQHCEFWVQAAKKFAFLTTWDRAVEIRQEDLLRDPEGAFDRITRHIGIEDHPNPVNYVRTTLVHSRGDKSTRENVDVKKSLTERPPSYETWNSAQRETFKRICGDSMEKLGYDIPF